MIAAFKPAGRVALLGSVATLVIIGLIAFTRASERPKLPGSSSADYLDTPASSFADPRLAENSSSEMQRLSQQLADLNKQVRRQEEKVADLEKRRLN